MSAPVLPSELSVASLSAGAIFIVESAGRVSRTRLDSIGASEAITNLSIPGTLSVSGAAVLQNLAVGGTLSVSAPAVIQTLRVGGTFTGSGAAVFSNGLTISGGLELSTGTLRAGSTLSVSAESVLQNLIVGGTASISGAAVFTTQITTGHTTTSGTANGFLSGAGLIQRSTSSLRYKNVEGEMPLEEARNIVLNAVPINFRSKNDDGRHFGFAAEWMAQLDERAVSFYNEKPDWVEYPALTAPLTKVAQDHEERLKQIEDFLKANLNAINPGKSNH